MTREELLTWKGKKHNGFLIVLNHDLHAGFGALLLYALNGIRRAEFLNLIPVIDFNSKNSPYFFDIEKGDNIWEYFFEKISPYSSHKIKAFLKAGVLQNKEVSYMTSKEAAHTHQFDPHRIATFWAWEKPSNKAIWMKEKRALGRTYVQQYVQPKIHIIEKVNRFIDDFFRSNLVIGVHIRGSDFAYARPTPIKEYFEAVDILLKETPDNNFKIFVATDQKQFLEAFKRRYGQKVLHQNVTRSDSHIAPFRFNNISGYTKGEEVLLDILLLSKCDHLIKGAAAVGELALWFTDDKFITDFALQSEFNQKQYHELESAYALMNVAKKSKVALKAHRLRERVVRQFIESRLGKAIYYRSAFFRKVFKH